MNYPIIINKRENGGYNVTVPDLLSCSASGENLDAAILNACEAVYLCLSRMIEEGFAIPLPSDMDKLQRDPDFEKAIFAVVSIDMDNLPTKMTRVHITLAEHLLKTTDVYSKKYGKSRSGLITRALVEFFSKH